jgi:acetyl-CoA C-acetyltransferase
MRQAMIVAPVRTGAGKFLGTLAPLSAEQLAARVIDGVVERSRVDPARIDDVVFTQGYPNSEAPCIGRWAALAAGLPIEIPGLQLDRRCGGGLQAVATTAMMAARSASAAQTPSARARASQGSLRPRDDVCGRRSRHRRDRRANLRRST